MTPEELAAIEARANAATPGPWHCDDHGRIQSLDGHLFRADWEGDMTWENPADSQLIVAARTDIPALVAEVRRLRATYESWRPMVDAWLAENIEEGG